MNVRDAADGSSRANELIWGNERNKVNKLDAEKMRREGKMGKRNERDIDKGLDFWMFTSFARLSWEDYREPYSILSLTIKSLI